jgi:type I restriction enzyme S subunit
VSVPLISVAEVALGRQRSPQHEIGPHQVPYLRSANIRDGELDLTDVKSMNFSPAEQQMFRLTPGDVLLTEGSGSRDAVGASSVWRGELDGTVCFQNTVLRMRPRAGVSDGRYLAWWARHAHGSGLFAAAATGANILHLGAESLRQLPVVLPSLGKQREIANFLDDQVARIDSVTDAVRRRLSLLESRSARQCSDLLTGAAQIGSLSAWAPFGRVPPGWFDLKLRNLAVDVQTGPFGSLLHADEYLLGGIPVVNPANLQGGQIVPFDEVTISPATRDRLGRYALKRGDVVFGRRGELGRAGLVTDAEAGWLCGTGALRLRVADGRLIPEFLSALLRIPAVRFYFDSQAVGSTMANLNTGILLGLPIMLPPRAVQTRLLDQLNNLTSLYERLVIGSHAQASLMQERKRALITACVMGEFDVSTASNHAAAAVIG